VIIDCNATSTITALLDNNLVKFITFNSKKVVYESKTYFVINIYAYIGNDTAIRLRNINTITDESQTAQIIANLSKILESYNKKYKILVFEGSVKDEDSSVKLFSKY
jgi:hypothetical protein